LLNTATLTRTAVGATSADGIILTNTTAAAVGAQQYSPRLRLTGQGWKSNATAESQTVDWTIENQPVQSGANALTNLVFRSQVNAGGYGTRLFISHDGSLNNVGGHSSAIMSSDSSAFYLTTAGYLQLQGGGNFFKITNGGSLQWYSGGFDTIFGRKAAATLQMGTDVNGSAVAQSFGSCAGITGTDKTGANMTLFSGPGTGAGAVSSLIFQTPTVLGSGTTAQSLATRLTISSASVTSPISLIAHNATAIPAGGTAGAGVMFSSTANYGVFFGSGAPSLSAAKGSLYLRSDGTGTSNRAYINTDGSTTWTALTTVG